MNKQPRQKLKPAKSNSKSLRERVKILEKRIHRVIKRVGSLEVQYLNIQVKNLLNKAANKISCFLLVKTYQI